MSPRLSRPIPSTFALGFVYERYGPPSGLELRDIGVPDVGDNDVLIRVHAAALNPSDWHRLTGTPYIARLEAGLRTPKRNIPGTDVAGTVAAAGSAVTDLSPGDAVFGWTGGGACAEHVAFPAHQLIAKPERPSTTSQTDTPKARSSSARDTSDHFDDAVPDRPTRRRTAAGSQPDIALGAPIEARMGVLNTGASRGYRLGVAW